MIIDVIKIIGNELRLQKIEFLDMLLGILVNNLLESILKGKKAFGKCRFLLSADHLTNFDLLTKCTKIREHLFMIQFTKKYKKWSI